MDEMLATQLIFFSENIRMHIDGQAKRDKKPLHSGEIQCSYSVSIVFVLIKKCMAQTFSFVYVWSYLEHLGVSYFE